MKTLTRLRLGLACAILIVGCASQPPALLGQRDLLQFVEDGKTSRSDAVAKLGAPFANYEGERIMTWRLAKDEGGYIVTGQRAQPGQPQNVPDYELVLIFGPQGLLQQHNLVALRPAR